MRQIGTLPDAADAVRFVAFLITQRIDAHAEQEETNFTIWVEDEDQLDLAKTELEKFRASPQDPRYDNVLKKAAQLKIAEMDQQKAATKNVVQMSGQWQRGGSGGAFKRAPLTMLLIAISIFITFSTNFGGDGKNSRSLYLSAEPQMVWQNDRGEVVGRRLRLPEVMRGEIWRLVTPMFIHLSWAHIVFNMMWLYILGLQIEQRYRTWRLGVFVLMIAIASDLAQYFWTGNPYFGGMSGVNYGLFGFIWMKMLFDPQSGLYIDRTNIILMIGWLFACLLAEQPAFSHMLGWIGKVANTAHFVGLGMGMVIATVPLLWKGRHA